MEKRGIKLQMKRLFPTCGTPIIISPPGRPRGTRIVTGVVASSQTGEIISTLGIIDLASGIVTETPGVRDIKPWLPAWSPQADKIVFVSDYDGNDIWTVNVDGSELKRLTHTKNAWEPDWTPEGTHIVYSQREDDLQTIYIMAADGANKRTLFQPQFLAGHPRM